MSSTIPSSFDSLGTVEGFLRSDVVAQDVYSSFHVMLFDLGPNILRQELNENKEGGNSCSFIYKVIHQLQITYLFY